MQKVLCALHGAWVHVIGSTVIHRHDGWHCPTQELRIGVKTVTVLDFVNHHVALNESEQY